ncbi:MAG: DUF2950 family protein [Candidatus Omnitrophota bacterium]
MDLANKYGRMSLFSIFSIIALILICITTWKMLDLGLDTYKKMATSKHQSKYSSKTPLKAMPVKANRKLNQLPKPQKMSRESHIQAQTNPILQKLAVGYYILKAKLENANNQQLIAQNEKIAINLLVKYVKAQEQYRQYYGYYAKSAGDLVIKDNAKYTMIDPELLVLNSANCPEQADNGYFYLQTSKAGSEPEQCDGYCLNAIPVEYGQSGLNSFCIDQKGIILQENNGGMLFSQPMPENQSAQFNPE